VVIHSGSVKVIPIKAKVKAILYGMSTIITMSKKIQCFGAQGKEPQQFKCLSLDKGDRGSSSKIDWEALLPSEAKQNNL
jgi:hypothetical protein